MRDTIQILIFVICGIIFLWLGHFLFFGPPSPLYPYMPWSKKKEGELDGKPGDPMICPVCSMRMERGELVKTVAFGANTQSKDKLMHIKGCFGCLERDLPRRCPICKAKLSIKEYLVSRMFERNYQKNHIHVLGCVKCRKR